MSSSALEIDRKSKREKEKERDIAAEDSEFSEIMTLLLSGKIVEGVTAGNGISGVSEKLYDDIKRNHFHWVNNEKYLSEAILIIIKRRAFHTLYTLLDNYLIGEGNSRNLINMLEKQNGDYITKCGTYLFAVAAKRQDFDLLRFLLNKNIKLDHDSLSLYNGGSIFFNLILYYHPKRDCQLKFEAILGRYRARLEKSSTPDKLPTECAQELTQVTQDIFQRDLGCQWEFEFILKKYRERLEKILISNESLSQCAKELTRVTQGFFQSNVDCQGEFEVMLRKFRELALPKISSTADKLLTECLQELMQARAIVQGIAKKEQEYIDILTLYVEKYYEEEIYRPNKRDIERHASEEAEDKVVNILRQYIFRLDLKLSKLPAAKPLIISPGLGGKEVVVADDLGVPASTPLLSPHSKGDQKSNFICS